MTSKKFSSYLENSSKDELEEIIQKAKDWALMHGIGMRSKKNYDPGSLIVAPFTLFPSPVPCEPYKKALQIQKTLNNLMFNIVNDNNFLTEALKDILKYDDFTKRLFTIYETVRKEGIRQTISFGVFRSDYMVSQDHKLKQVEINTISSSMATFGSRILNGHSSSKTTRKPGEILANKELKKYILNELNLMDNYINIPDNQALEDICDSFLKAWNCFPIMESCILFVVEDVTFNICDQKFMEYKIRQRCNNIKIIRKSLAQVTTEARLSESGDLYVGDDLVAVVYYRTGYDPRQYREKDWETRLLIERSTAIKCPSIDYHLAGTKKVQQVLSQKGILERLQLSRKEIATIKEMLVPIYPLDLSKEGEYAYNLAMTEPQNWVMKPQREGGGNNVYGEDIPEVLSKMSREEAAGWILMGLIEPLSTKNCIVRYEEYQIADIVSELGIYGVLLGSKDDLILNKVSGHMLRSKLSTANEGGVAAGLGALDSPYLYVKSPEYEPKDEDIYMAVVDDLHEVKIVDSS